MIGASESDNSEVKKFEIALVPLLLFSSSNNDNNGRKNILTRCPCIYRV